MIARKKSLNWAISKKKKNFFSHSFPKCDNLRFAPFLLSSFTKCACVIASLTDTEPSLHIHFIFMPFNLNYFMMQNVVMKGCLIAWNIWQCNRCQQNNQLFPWLILAPSSHRKLGHKKKMILNSQQEGRPFNWISWHLPFIGLFLSPPLNKPSPPHTPPHTHR